MEIKPQELRIGNLVYASALKAIRVIDPLDIRDLHEGRLYQPFQAIELTPEWLERFGFKLVESNELKYYEIYINGINLYEGGKNGFVEVILNGHEESVRVRYVHQLQNLFYSLTGEELAIDKTSLKN